MKNRIRRADNIDFMRSLGPGSVNLVLTSPPYNIGKEYEKSSAMGDYVEWQVRVASESVRVLADGGSICWQIGNRIVKGEVYPLDVVFYRIFKDLGLKLRNRVVWHFEHGLHCSNRLSGRYETVLWFTKGDEYLFNLDSIRVPSKYPNKKHYKGPNKGELSGNPLGKNPGDMWSIPNVKANHVEKTAHPCQFPVELAERFILSLTGVGDSVLDPHLGAGSTAIAAVKNGRVALGCDTSEAYIKIATDRLAALGTGELKTRNGRAH